MRISLGRHLPWTAPLCTDVTDGFPYGQYYVNFSAQARSQEPLCVLPMALPIGSTMRLSLDWVRRGQAHLSTADGSPYR